MSQLFPHDFLSDFFHEVLFEVCFFLDHILVHKVFDLNRVQLKILVLVNVREKPSHIGFVSNSQISDCLLEILQRQLTITSLASAFKIASNVSMGLNLASFGDPSDDVLSKFQDQIHTIIDQIHILDKMRVADLALSETVNLGQEHNIDQSEILVQSLKRLPKISLTDH